MIEKAKKGEKLRIVSDQFMSPTYTRDVAFALSEFLKIMPEYGVYHMTNDGFCSWYEFTKAIFEILGWDVEVEAISSEELGRLARRPRFSALSVGKLRRIGIEMRHWKEALRDYLAERKQKH